MPKPLAKILSTSLLIGLLAFPYSALNVIHQDELFEAVHTPQTFKSNYMPPKVRILPKLGQHRMSGEVSIQFWLKSVQNFNRFNPIIRIFFNKSTTSYFDFKAFYQTNDKFAFHPSFNRFVQERRSPNSFKEWSRISINFQVEYPSQNEMSLSIRNYVDRVGGFPFDHVFSGINFWELSRMEMIFAERIFTNNQMDQ